MLPSKGSYQHGPPLLHRLREPPVTRPPRSYAALRLPATVGLGSGSPRRWPTSSADASSSPSYASTRGRVPVGDGLPALRKAGCCPRSVQDLPGYRSVPSMRAEVIHHARCALASPILFFFLARTLPPSGILAPWAPGNNRFRGRIPPVHMHVDLRITVTVTRHSARSYFRPAGLTL
jgi:hypothetical protein